MGLVSSQVVKSLGGCSRRDPHTFKQAIGGKRMAPKTNSGAELHYLIWKVLEKLIQIAHDFTPFLPNASTASA